MLNHIGRNMATSMKNSFFCILFILSSCINSNKEIIDTIEKKIPVIVDMNQFLDFFEKNSKCSFYFEKYEYKNHHDYFIVKIVGDRSDAIGKFRVITKNPALNKIISSKGMGYRGAKLLNLKYESIEGELLCVNIEKVID